jgi:hydrazine synthase alpha subunit-like protein
MNRQTTIVKISLILAVSFTCLFCSSCTSELKEGTIILTQVDSAVNFEQEDSYGCFSKARIVAINPDKPEGLKVLTEAYYSAQSPEISYDGKKMLFAAQKEQDDSWQVWEMNLKNLKTKKITSFPEGCIDPAYLPGNRLIFSKLYSNSSVKKGYALFSANLDGSEIKQITYNPYHANVASTVLSDGRILANSIQLYPDVREPLLNVCRPDGTKSDMFYKSSEGNRLSGRPWETRNGKIVFIETNEGRQKEGDIVTIKYNRPLHTRINNTIDIKGDFRHVFSQQSGKFLVSYRSAEDKQYALYEFDPETNLLGKTIYHDPDYNVMEAVLVEKRARPQKLPSEVDMGVKTGLILCQDVNFFGPETDASFAKASRIEVLGVDSILGVVDVEEDGSVYIKIIADTPFQIQTIDKEGKVLNGPSGWIWMRPNERRGCVGCHEDPELVPENRLPLAVTKAPAIVPVYISNIKEKEISLE